MQTDESKKLGAAIGPRLRAFRESQKKSQSAFAGMIGGKLRGLQDNEAGESSPNSKMLRALADLGLNINWLLTGNGPIACADLAGAINEELLCEALEAVEEERRRWDCAVSPRKLAEIAIFLYAEWRQPERRDRSMAARLVKIACTETAPPFRGIDAKTAATDHFDQEADAKAG